MPRKGHSSYFHLPPSLRWWRTPLQKLRGICHATICYIANLFLIHYVQIAIMTYMKTTLSELSLDFATNVTRMCDDIKNRAHIKNQLLRSCCSIGANIHEARYAYSRDDFAFKLQIAIKECNETFYWLELLKRTETVQPDVLQPLVNQCTRIRYMLSKSLNTTKKNNNSWKSPFQRTSWVLLHSPHGGILLILNLRLRSGGEELAPARCEEQLRCNEELRCEERPFGRWDSIKKRPHPRSADATIFLLNHLY